MRLHVRDLVGSARADPESTVGRPFVAARRETLLREPEFRSKTAHPSATHGRSRSRKGSRQRAIGPGSGGAALAAPRHEAAGRHARVARRSKARRPSRLLHRGRAGVSRPPTGLPAAGLSARVWSCVRAIRSHTLVCVTRTRGGRLREPPRPVREHRASRSPPCASP